jgi:hypothetical protein
MYCPICRTEYREGFFKCADCMVPLVKSLAPEKPDPIQGYEELQEIMTSFDPCEIEIIKSILDDNNISCLVDGQNFACFGSMPARISVPENQAIKAMDLLKKSQIHGSHPSPG